MIRPFILMLTLLAVYDIHAQSVKVQTATGSDPKGMEPVFSTETAWDIVHDATTSRLLWRNEGDSLRSDLGRLLDHAIEPYDSIRNRLAGLDLHAVSVKGKDLLRKDSIRIRWLNDSTFVIDSLGWSLDLLLKQVMQISYPVDFSTLTFSDSILDESGMLDSTLFLPDTLEVTVIDTAALEALEIRMLGYSENRIIPSLDDLPHRRSARISADSSRLIFTDTLSVWTAGDDTPFRYLSGRHQLDSLQNAIETLMASSDRRDSTRILINDMYGTKTPMWLSEGDSESRRFWVKNYKNDSITLWIGNPGNREISLLLEDDIDFNRLSKEQLGHLPMSIPEPSRELAKMVALKPDPIFWEYEVSNAFTFNQTYLSNWAKGGENSLATMLDITGNATYNNTQDKTQWINTVRLKFGTLITQEHGLRKNNDLFEISSQINKNKWGKFDLSASFYMLNQIAKGYKYPNDSVVVSKFLNPASLTIGLGLDYKPFKNTAVNLAPLSYKNTFVLDTASIDQTRHGISSDKRALQELGTQILITNKVSPLEDLTISNKLRIFSNYLNHPENIDIDWEMLLDKKISWFFTIRINLHLIYDDDVRFTVYDEFDQPVMRLDGTEKKVARTQFKEFVGLSLLFKF